jgi:hypothetical protein
MIMSGWSASGVGAASDHPTPAPLLQSWVMVGCEEIWLEALRIVEICLLNHSC